MNFRCVPVRSLLSLDSFYLWPERSRLLYLAQFCSWPARSQLLDLGNFPRDCCVTSVWPVTSVELSVTASSAVASLDLDEISLHASTVKILDFNYFYFVTWFNLLKTLFNCLGILCDCLETCSTASELVQLPWNLVAALELVQLPWNWINRLGTWCNHIGTGSTAMELVATTSEPHSLFNIVVNGLPLYGQALLYI